MARPTTQPDLFAPAKPPPRSPSVTLIRGAFADVALEDLLDDIKPEQFGGSMYGNSYDRPRLEAWFGLRPYTFGGGPPMEPREWTPRLLLVRRIVESLTGESFDSCFVNYYRDGSDHISWHADDERWIGPVITSVSVGAARKFAMKPKDGSEGWHEWQLGHGDLLTMHAGTQQAWQHSLRKTAKPVGPRLNLTFRQTRGAR